MTVLSRLVTITRQHLYQMRRRTQNAQEKRKTIATLRWKNSSSLTLNTWLSTALGSIKCQLLGFATVCNCLEQSIPTINHQGKKKTGYFFP